MTDDLKQEAERMARAPPPKTTPLIKTRKPENQKQKTENKEYKKMSNNFALYSTAMVANENLNIQEGTDMAHNNENGTAQTQQETASQPLNAQTAALLANNNGTAQQNTASQTHRAQEGVVEATAQEREQRSVARASTTSNPMQTYQHKLEQVRHGLKNKISPKITRKELSISKAEYRDLYCAVCLIDGVDYEMPSEASTVRKATTSEHGILVSAYNIETMGADKVFSEGTLTIPSYDVANKRIIISLYSG